MFFKSKGIIGLDIGSNALKVAELKQSRGGYQLKTIGESFLPPESIVNKVITKPEEVSDHITNLIRDLGIKSRNAAISISGHSVIIKKVTLPSMSDEELAESIPWELEQYLPQSIEDVNYDYQILPGETPEGNMDVIIVAAKKDITNDYVNIVTGVGLRPVIVDVDVFALENMYDINYEPSEGLVALVNIGASVTNINILKDGISVFTRDISTGGNQYTEWLMKEMDVNFLEAEQMKFNLGNGDTPVEVERVTGEFIDLISGEIKRTLDFFVSNFWKDRISKIVLGGGSSKVRGLTEVLNDVTDTEVEMVNPFRNIQVSDGDFDPTYIHDISPKMSVAVGLAMRKVGDK